MAVRKPYIGQMDRKIVVYENIKTQNDIGEAKEEKKKIAECWARVDTDTGSEKVEGNVRHLLNKSFTIRFNRVIFERGNEFVVEYNKQLYNITHVAEIGRRSNLQLICFVYD
ncbi:head-tail adaptor protein [Myroides sp. DF42-4-2]|uniref:phage head completion protein n=1 Tax=unclassified Myroides TaxID=2642485 RepID=UPI002574FD1C|nr:head-tail adaptor protein [Myroides sp. DF42-4-2]MDM1408058.1 head-tail adaptor protein [Myroides sp. DF42-4-2]